MTDVAGHIRITIKVEGMVMDAGYPQRDNKTSMESIMA